MTMESFSRNLGEGGPDGITAALDLLMEEVERQRKCANHAGAEALRDGDLKGAKTSMAQSEILTEFYSKAAALQKEWRRLANTSVLNGGEKSGAGRRNHGKLSKGLRTPESAFIRPILQVLSEMGGQGKTAIIVARVGEAMRTVLRDVDYETLRSDGRPRWQKAANWARDYMVRDGLLEPDSPHGTWEISEAGRTRLES